MPRTAKSKREEALRLYLTGEVTTATEIARRLRVKRQTVGVWKREDSWDDLRLKVDRRAAEKLVEQLATERVTLNAQHFKLWGVVVAQLVEALQQRGLQVEEIRTLEREATILERAQKGQRLARGLSLEGQTEEQVRAEAAAELRTLIDLFVDTVKREIPDEDLRDRLAQALLARLPFADEVSDAS